MAKIIPFPGLPFSQGNSGSGAYDDGFSLSSDDEWEEHIALSRWWRLGHDILASIPPSGFVLAAGGTLPDILVRQLHSVHIKPWRDRFSRPVGNERDSRDIVLVHWMLEHLKLIKVTKGRLTLTRSGSDILEDPASLFSLFFDLSIAGIHWDTDNHQVSGDYLQSLFPASLQLIGELCTDWISCGKLIAHAETELNLRHSSKDMPMAWYHSTIRNCAEPLGLVELRESSAELRRWDIQDEELCVTPLFISFLQ